jgi:hypothetical protein
MYELCIEGSDIQKKDDKKLKKDPDELWKELKEWKEAR